MKRSLLHYPSAALVIEPPSTNSPPGIDLDAVAAMMHNRGEFLQYTTQVDSADKLRGSLLRTEKI
jgi:hypothetical protein